jgi:SAM-dependent methyltransferase
MLERAVKRAVGRGRLFRIARRVYYVGRRVRCPCCGRSFRRFVPIPRTHEPDLECPGCGSYSRHRQLWLFLTERLDVLSAPLALLHVAPDTFFSRRLERARNLRYLSVDLEAPHAMERMDVTALALEDDSFDAVVCSHVLEHVSDDRRALRELHRVLKPGGWAVIQAPVNAWLDTTREDPSVHDPGERARRFGAEDHVRLYGRDYAERLEAAGFAVRVIPFASELDPARAARFGLLPTEDIHLCRKSRRGDSNP